jgi:1-deoxy-D-xylulose-5-phosphate synthase
VTLEENSVIGGAGSEIARALETMGIAKPLLRLGLPDIFIEHGEQGQMLAELGLNTAALVARIENFNNA